MVPGIIIGAGWLTSVTRVVDEIPVENGAACQWLCHLGCVYCTCVTRMYHHFGRIVLVITNSGPCVLNTVQYGGVGVILEITAVTLHCNTRLWLTPCRW